MTPASISYLEKGTAHSTLPSLGIVCTIQFLSPKRKSPPLLINRKLSSLRRMEQSLLVINGVRSEKPIAGIAQTGKDLAVLVELVVDCTNGNTNVGLFFSQFHQTIAAGNDAQDVNLGNAPLRPTRQICNNSMLAHEIDSQDAIDSEMQCRLHRVNCSRMKSSIFSFSPS